ncbi:MAG: hypothetical protein H6Q33_4663 [Deltaproteobacteria bacterium]|nr:hypothetical protein [Deltaproteobacteria bacterium]
MPPTLILNAATRGRGGRDGGRVQGRGARSGAVSAAPSERKRALSLRPKNGGPARCTGARPAHKQDGWSYCALRARQRPVFMGWRQVSRYPLSRMRCVVPRITVAHLSCRTHCLAVRERRSIFPRKISSRLLQHVKDESRGLLTHRIQCHTACPAAEPCRAGLSPDRPCHPQHQSPDSPTAMRELASGRRYRPAGQSWRSR